MRVNRGLLGWGVFFIVLGAVPLAVRGGLVNVATVALAWELWPLLLIGAGLSLVLRRTRAAAVGNLLVGLTFGLIGGGLLVGGLGSVPASVCGTGGSAGPATSGGAPPFVGALGAGASVEVTVNCGSLTVATQPGSQWSVARGPDPQPQILAADSGQLRVAFGRDRRIGIGTSGTRWQMGLPADPALDVTLAVNAGSAQVALGSAHVSALTASVNAGDATIDLGGAVGTTSVTGSVNAGSMKVALPTPQGTLGGSFSANVGSVGVCSPAGVPLRIRVGAQPLGSNNFAQRGMTQAGDTWTRGAWDGAASRIDLTVSANLGSIALDPEDGCG